MAGELMLPIIGNLIGDPELRFTPTGKAVATFTIAHNTKNFEQKTGQWVDGPSVFMRCVAWNALAENITESLKKGDRVICQGKLVQKNYETDAGEKRSSMELQVDDIGPALRFATAKIMKQTKNGNQSSNQNFPQTRQNDPWA